MNSKRARVIAFYLPQYHPIPENDTWWGKGFTEWTNVTKARPLFAGHHQPRLPADLGFYDLRVPETRAAQAEMARAHGVEAFCYWHYWFAGRRLLERPFREVLTSGEPSFPFCLGWANASWSGIWHGCPDRILIEQSYPGDEDHEAHFRSLLPAFEDPRYLLVDGKPFFLVLRPTQIPAVRRFTDLWRSLATQEGLPGLYLVGCAREPWHPHEGGFDAAVDLNLPYREPTLDPRQLLRRLLDTWTGRPTILDYETASDQILEKNRTAPSGIFRHVNIFPDWDNTPRSGKNGLVFRGSTPELFRKVLRRALSMIADRPFEHRLLFVKSWNEWAEGNYLEPDHRSGHAYLEVLRDEVCRVHLE